MQRHSARHALTSTRTGDQQPTICVVDPRPDDYQSWRDAAATNGLRLKFFASAEAALRHARVASVELWVVSTVQPGLSGCDLCEMLRRQSPRVPVYLVAEEYSVEVEQEAWRARASMFGCKPESSHWLDEWLAARCHGSARRSVTAPGAARNSR